ncbi:MAG: di-trans,poly-cis-decaprenylcistransferase [Clostridiales bacterium GWF2_36_10]|nr:MAG: di-trans,poly-cis-decaprenylcistransferase [Clostridiales bacterium GWF2_36_10]HAN21313.1 isoprenyl transferase [Clostridiales bacterium]
MQKNDIDIPKVIPKHIAIIMDGNGRWARKRALPRTAGHKAGFDNFIETVRVCGRIGVSYLTVYAFSTENWRREKGEVDELIRLMNNGITRFLPEMQENNIKLRILGDLSMFDEKSRTMLEDSVKILSGNTKMVLSICLSYGGRNEILQAINRIIAEGNSKNNITEKEFESYLYTSDIPDPDLIIRTSGEMRTSNFLLWQSAYSEYYFTDVLWPDFKKGEFYKAIEEYNSRNRRYGK